MNDVIQLPISNKNNQKAVLVQYFQSDTLYILRNDGSVISTDNLNGIYSITEGENLTAEFNELFKGLNLVEMNLTQEEFEEFEEKVQQFLNKTQDINKIQKPFNEDIKHFLKELNDEEILLVIKYGECL